MSMAFMLRLGAVVMKVTDLDRAGAFWSEALSYDRHPQNPAFLMPEEAAPGTRLHLTTKTGRTSTCEQTMRPISRPRSSA